MTPRLAADRRRRRTRERSRPPRRGNGERRAASGYARAREIRRRMVRRRRRRRPRVPGGFLVSVLFLFLFFGRRRIRRSGRPRRRKRRGRRAVPTSHCRRGSPFGRDGARLAPPRPPGTPPGPPFVASGSRVVGEDEAGSTRSKEPGTRPGRRSRLDRRPRRLNETTRSPRSPTRAPPPSLRRSPSPKSRFRPTSAVSPNGSSPSSPFAPRPVARARGLFLGALLVDLREKRLPRRLRLGRPLLQVRNEQRLLDAVRERGVQVFVKAHRRWGGTAARAGRNTCRTAPASASKRWLSVIVLS